MAENEKSVSVSELAQILAAQQKMFAEAQAEAQRRSDDRMAQLIAEMKKPTVMEQIELDKKAAEILARNQERKDNAAGMKVKRDADRWEKHHCTHAHPNGNTHCVHIIEKVGPGYILCQRNQCIIRPEPAPANYGGDDIYDTNQFNRLFQSLPSQELFQ